MSKQDTHFFNMFGLVLGILITVAIILFGVSRAIGNNTQAKDVLSEREFQRAVTQRIAPLSHEAIAGQDNSKLAIVETPAAAMPVAAVPKTGTELFTQTCSACHAQGIAGAPKAGDTAAWAPRIAQGKPTLYKHALDGYTGKAGVMPPKGGRPDVSDDIVRQAVDHMIELAH